jgi:hypothetical protein
MEKNEICKIIEILAVFGYDVCSLDMRSPPYEIQFIPRKENEEIPYGTPRPLRGMPG